MRWNIILSLYVRHILPEIWPQSFVAGYFSSNRQVPSTALLFGNYLWSRGYDKGRAGLNGSVGLKRFIGCLCWCGTIGLESL